MRPRVENTVYSALNLYAWPGNIRELENVIERALVLDRDGVLTLEDLPDRFRGPERRLGNVRIELPDEGISLEEVERQLLLAALEMHNWNPDARRWLPWHHPEHAVVPDAEVWPRAAQRAGRLIPQSCACRGGTTDVLGSCGCGVSAEPERECCECAVLLHTVAWRIDELLDEAPRFLPAEPDVSIQFGAIESTARTDAVRSRIDALVRTFAEIGTVTEEFSQHCGAAHLPVIRRLANELLVRCSALDEVLGFPEKFPGT